MEIDLPEVVAEVRAEFDRYEKALVYALDVRRVGDQYWMYFNARDGWFLGKERIGLATCPVEVESDPNH